MRVIRFVLTLNFFPAVKAVIIHPATEKHVQKYSDQEKFVVHETAELYEQVTLPLIKSKPFSIQVNIMYNVYVKIHLAVS